MIDETELQARVSRYRLVRSLMSRADDQAVIDRHIFELESELARGQQPDDGAIGKKPGAAVLKLVFSRG